MAELDVTWNTFLTGLEDLGVDGLPADMEIDLRHVMNLESPSLRVFEPDELDDDLLEPFGFFPMDSEELKKAAEPFMLLPDRLSLNSWTPRKSSHRTLGRQISKILGFNE